jgi:L-fuconolactonase
MKLDAHQHFWKYDAAQYGWIPKGSPLERDWLPPDLAKEQAHVGMNGSIAVQARQSLEESRWLLELAEHHAAIKGVVGWVDVRADNVEDQLARFAPHPKFVGVRHVVQDEPDNDFMLRADFRRGLGRLRQFQLTYDILIYPRQLPAAIQLVRQFPEQPFVLDHLAKPFIRDGILSPWKEHIAELARSPNVWCKVTEARRDGWKREDFHPCLDVVFEQFGAGRLMFGSDWPVCLLAGSYAEVFGIVRDYLAAFDARQRDQVLGENCARFYGVK